MAQQKLLAYQVYLLHCWEETGTAATTGLWRFSLENPVSGQRREFANLRELVIALNTELNESRYRRLSHTHSRAVPTD